MLLTKANIQNCVCISILALRHENRFFPALYCIFMSGLYGRTIFSTFSHKKHDFRKILLNSNLLWFSLQLMSEIFIIIRRIQLNMIVNAKSRHGKYPLFLSDINEIWVFSTELWIMLKYQISWKSIQWESGCSMRTDGRTVRHDEANSCISKFCVCAWIRCVIKRRRILPAACGPQEKPLGQIFLSHTSSQPRVARKADWKVASCPTT
jgi:hypothetical protein